jgi:subtilase family protein
VHGRCGDGEWIKEGNPKEYPAAYPGVIAVGATTRSHRPLLPSAAGGSDETKYAEWSGTSMATPHVTAAVSLLIAKHPNLTPQQVAERLNSTATKLPVTRRKDFTREFGHGLLNIEAALSWGVARINVKLAAGTYRSQANTLLARTPGFRSVIQPFPDDPDDEMRRMDIVEVVSDGVGDALQQLQRNPQVEFAHETAPRKLVR